MLAAITERGCNDDDKSKRGGPEKLERAAPEPATARWRRWRVGALAAPVVGLPHDRSGCRRAARRRSCPERSRDARRTWTIFRAQNWLYYDPAKLYEINPASGFQVVYECLYHIPDGYEIGTIEPLLAEDMPAVSDDGLTATIKIKPGVKFHNTGNEMTADDWVWSWNRLKNLLGNPSFLVTDFIESFSAVDPTTIEIKLLSPNAALAAILTSLPFAVTDSKAAQENGGVAEEGADESDKLTDWLNKGNSIGTGPYRLAQWDIANEIILENNRGLLGRRRRIRPDHLPECGRLEHPASAPRDRGGGLCLFR